MQKYCCIPVYHLYVIRAKNRDNLQSYLKERGITTLVHYPVCIGKTEAFSNVSFNTPICEELSNCILSLPMYPNLINQPQKIQYVVKCIKMFYGYLSYTVKSLFEIKNGLSLYNKFSQYVSLLIVFPTPPVNSQLLNLKIIL